PAAAGATRDATVVTAAAPSYPPQAARNRTEGWVEVEFTVTAEGTVANARVVNSDPPRVFDREAIRSIERATYRPRLENGNPVSSTLRRRIEFKLNG
ncbi:MAG: energy transducer TonB, partial [Xanthomonadales bacterium]|nr:energy transducer TonB [Xanthomonadales bacterium]